MIHRILVTGGAGFIGSAIVRHLIEIATYDVVNLDNLTYAGNLESLASIADSSRYSSHQLEICYGSALDKLLS